MTCHKHTLFSLSVHYLHVLWYEQRDCPTFMTGDGQSIRLADPGEWNQGPGPAFKQATFFLNDQTLVGDVAIEWHPADWKEDGDVALLVAYWKPKIAVKTTAIQLFLEDQLPLTRRLQAQAYPTKGHGGNGRCSKKWFSGWEPEKIERFFQRLAIRGLKQKQKELLQHFHPFGYGIARALGLEELFSYLYPYRDWEEEKLFSLSLGVCGFFESPFQKRWASSARYGLFFSLWEQLDHHPVVQVRGMRGNFHPVRRLLYLVKLLQGEVLNQLIEEVAKAWNQVFYGEHLYAFWERAIPTYEEAYWSDRWVFEEQPTKRPIALIGRERKREIILQVFLPLFYRREKRQRVLDFLSRITLSKRAKKRLFQGRFFGDRYLIKDVVVEEGASHLFRSYCLAVGPSCNGCPFLKWKG